MIQVRTHEDGNRSYIDRVQDAGNLDYVKDGELVRGAPLESVMVTAESDLASLTGYEPGTIAYTAGFKAMWQLSAAGQWVSL